MIVEDEAVVAMNLRSWLLHLGYESAGSAASGREAIRLAEVLRPDLVLMDIRLSGDMDGVKAAEEITGRLNIPVVYLTAYADDEILQRAKMTEPFGYVLKPFGIREIHATIEMALYRSRIQRELKESHERLRTTLRCIGEAVVGTDAQVRVNFLNPEAERLTGWENDEAADRGVDTVCRLLSRSGEPVNYRPVRQALADGAPIADNNGCLLVTKSGARVPIMDGAAPIQNGRGKRRIGCRQSPCLYR